MRVLLTGVAAVAIGIYAEIGFSNDEKDNPKKDPFDIAAAKGLKWLVSVQGKDGGWGQDGGETFYVRQSESSPGVGFGSSSPYGVTMTPALLGSVAIPGLALRKASP